MCSQNAQYVSRQHLENEVNFGHLEGINETLPSNHHQTLLFIQDYTKAENLLKQSIIQVLSTAQNAHLKLMTVSYPKNFLRAETNKPITQNISIRGEKMQSIMKKKDYKSNKKDLVAVSIVRGNMKNTTHWERRLIQRRHGFFSSVWSILRN